MLDSFIEFLEEKYILQRSSVNVSGCTWQVIQVGFLSCHNLVMSWLDDVGGVWCVWDMGVSPVEGP